MEDVDKILSRLMVQPVNMTEHARRWDPERLAPISRELYGDMLSVGWGAWTNISGDIVDPAPDAAHEFPLL